MNKGLVCFLTILLVLPACLPFGHGQDFKIDPSYLQTWNFMLACSFLSSLYNNALHLIRESPNSATYWISSDNILAQRVLAFCNNTTDMRQMINMSIQSCCGLGYDHIHEAILGVTIPSLIHAGNPPIVIANSTAGILFNNVTPMQAGGDYVVKWEVHNRTGILHDTDYGDVAAYNATELEHEHQHFLALDKIAILNRMWDGYGIVDNAYNVSTGYQTYKTALYLYALEQTGQRVPGSVEPHIFARRDVSGGFTTAYNQAGFDFPGAQRNAETTSIAILALANLPRVAVVINSISTTCNVLKQTAEVQAVITNHDNGEIYFNTTGYWDGTKLGNVPTVGLGVYYDQTVNFAKEISPNPIASYNVTVQAGNATKTTNVSGFSLWICQYLTLVSLIAIAAASLLTLTYLRRKRRLRTKTTLTPSQ